MRKLDLEGKELHKEVLEQSHSVLQDGYHLEATGKQTLVEHRLLALEEENLRHCNLGGDTVLLLELNKTDPGLE